MVASSSYPRADRRRPNACPLFVSLLVLLLSHCAFAQSEGQTPIHAVVDLSHSFTFYFDGRWTKQYVAPIGGKGATSFSTLSKGIFENANLLVLQSEGTPCRYPESDVAKVREFIERGGGVVVLGDYGVFKKETEYHLNNLAKAFGATFLDEGIRKPLKTVSEPTLTDELVCRGGKTIRLHEKDPEGKPTEWRVLIQDAAEKVVAAVRPVGKGRLMLASCSLSGSRPDATDPINDKWWLRVLPGMVVGLPVDPKKGVRGAGEDIAVKHDKLDLKHTEYLASYAKAMIEIYDECYPHIEAVMGVPPSPGQLTGLLRGGVGVLPGAGLPRCGDQRHRR